MVVDGASVLDAHNFNPTVWVVKTDNDAPVAYAHPQQLAVALQANQQAAPERDSLGSH